MNKQSQWLFEAPIALKKNCSCERCSPRSNYANFELEADSEAPNVVLQSPRFRNDSRLQTAANNRPPMRQGERGVAVKKLQQALIDLGFPMPVSTRRHGTSDGIYGSETTATVRKFQQKFQQKYSLKVDGVVGNMTMSALDKEMLDQEVIQPARRSAFQRCFLAFQRTAGIGPPPPPGRPDPREADRRFARDAAIKIFGQRNPNMKQIADVVSEMKNWLVSPDLPIVSAPGNDRNCGVRAAYVVGNRIPMRLCPTFFSQSSEEQIRTLIHEAAHLAGIGDSEGEAYYLGLNCLDENPQITFGTPKDGSRIVQADSWSKYVHCVCKLPPDASDSVRFKIRR